MANVNLNSAKRAKNDEFYTQWKDIEQEISAYLDYDKDLFRGKTILLPCDDPEWSNFTKYFVVNFKAFGLKKLISTSYAPSSKRVITTLFDTELKNYDKEQVNSRGKCFVLEASEEDNKTINVDNLEFFYLEGDGDFRSEEVTKLRDEADFVITNPPFSLFRDFVAWLEKGKDLKYSVVGNVNAISYKSIFPMIKDNKLWLGATLRSRPQVFATPKTYEPKESDAKKAASLGYAPNDRFNYTVISGFPWFTNIEHGKRKQPMSLLTMEDNLRYNNRVSKNKNAYCKYENLDAIEVPATSGIPSDYDGVMGVPISFLDKYCPEQFEILDVSNCPKVNGKNLYDRILIRLL